MSENTEIARLYKLSKLHKTAMIYEYNVVLTVRCIETTVSTVSTGVLSVLCANGFATIWDSAAVWIRSRIFEASANEFTTMLRSFLISSPIFALQQN